MRSASELALTALVVAVLSTSPAPGAQEQPPSPREYDLMPEVPLGLGPPDPEGVPFALIDSGIQQGHPQLQKLIIAQKDFTREGLDDALGHGTGVALSFLYFHFSPEMQKIKELHPELDRLPGILSARVIGRRPVAPQVTVDRIIAAIHWLATQKAKVVNLSIAMLEGTASFDKLCTVIAKHEEMLFIVAAGNFGPDAVVYPAACPAPNKLVSGAVSPEGQVAEYSGRSDVVTPLPPAPVSKVDYLRLTAERLVRDEEFEAATEAYEMAEELATADLDRALIAYGLGYIAFRRDDLSLAVRHFREAVTLAPEAPYLRLALANILSVTGELEGAAHLLEDLIAEGVKTPQVLDRYVRVLLDQDRPREAKPILDELLDKEPTLPDGLELRLAVNNRILILNTIDKGESLAPILRGLVEAGDAGLVAFAIRQGKIDVNTIPEGSEFPPLIYAGHFGHASVIRVLLAAGAEVGFQDPRYRLSALMMAANQDHVDAVKVLLEAGAPLDQQDYAGFSPLMFAAEQGHLEVARALLDAGANPDLRSEDGLTASELAARHGHQEIASLLSPPAPAKLRRPR